MLLVSAHSITKRFIASSRYLYHSLSNPSRAGGFILAWDCWRGRAHNDIARAGGPAARPADTTGRRCRGQRERPAPSRNTSQAGTGRRGRRLGPVQATWRSWLEVVPEEGVE